MCAFSVAKSYQLICSSHAWWISPQCTSPIPTMIPHLSWFETLVFSEHNSPSSVLCRIFLCFVPWVLAPELRRHQKKGTSLSRAKWGPEMGKPPFPPLANYHDHFLIFFQLRLSSMGCFSWQLFLTN